MDPKSGEICLVPSIPKCDWCNEPGPFDFKTVYGPWAHGCELHYRKHRQYNTLGVGKAQMWIAMEPDDTLA